MTQKRERSRVQGKTGVLSGQPGFRQKDHGAMFCKAARAMWESRRSWRGLGVLGQQRGWGCWGWGGGIGPAEGSPEQLRMPGEERLVGSHDEGHSELL